MKASNLLRAAAVLTFMLCLGHSAGGLSSWSANGGDAVFEAMRSSQFVVMGASRTYYQFYVGFGLLISVYLLAQAVLFWQLAGWADGMPTRVRPIVAVLFAATVACTWLDWMFFFAPPLILSAATAVCLGLALARMRSPERASISDGLELR